MNVFKINLKIRFLLQYQVYFGIVGFLLALVRHLVANSMVLVMNHQKGDTFQTVSMSCVPWHASAVP